MSPNKFDFDEMQSLAKRDPAAFARKREALIVNTIHKMLNPEKGRIAQFSIDQLRLRTLGRKNGHLSFIEPLQILVNKLSAESEKLGTPQREMERELP